MSAIATWLALCLVIELSFLLGAYSGAMIALLVIFLIPVAAVTLLAVLWFGGLVGSLLSTCLFIGLYFHWIDDSAKCADSCRVIRYRVDTFRVVGYEP